MRYIIGIDLGTTNSAIAYVDSQSPRLTIQQFKPLQLVSVGYTDMQPTLPSCCYLSKEHEWPQGSTVLPWQKEVDFFVGSCARDQGAKVPTRLVQSAKSWLCHSAASRREKILPFEAAEEERRISPIEASARYLNHIREAWNHQIAKGDVDSEFELQEIILTVPASFDEVARALTVEAAQLAGFRHLTLLEEPQAAFYAWLSRHEDSWEQLLSLGSSVLVCDVGGGTTDFSLIDVTGDKDKPQLQRMSVGNHLLLGGDNMDATVAHYLEKQLDFEPTQHEWMQLKHQARQAKEALLSDKDHFQVILHGSGSSVIGASRTLTVKREEIIDLLMKGFFTLEPWEEALKLNKGSGIRSMGLPYEEEPSICKHLAKFLSSSNRQPNFVLFNGGSMKPQLFQEAVVASLNKWFPNNHVQVLQSDSLDLAVARGAAYYGKVRRGLGIKVSGGCARGYYLGIDVEEDDGRVIKQAITLLPRGSDEGARYEPEHIFLVQPNSAVTFQLYTSQVRLLDASGDIITIDENELLPLPPIHTILRYGKTQERIPVHVCIILNAIGTLDLWLRSLQSEHRWKLEFQLRTAEGHENSFRASNKQLDEQLESHYLEKGKSCLQLQFSSSAKKSEHLMNDLEAALERPRNEWSLSVLRALWEALPKAASARNFLLARWWNIAGFLLRPGFGYPLDDFRLKELWLIILSEINNLSDPEILIQKAICYRRIAGGLNKGQQMQIAHTLLPNFWNKKFKGKSELYQYNENLRAIGSLELLDTTLKVKIGNTLIDKILAGQASSADFWALGRIGARQLFYGSVANVISREQCCSWIEKLLQLKENCEAQLPSVLGLLAHKTDQREINVPESMIDRILSRFPQEQLDEALKRSEMSKQQSEQMFGEKLPQGLVLRK